MAAEEKPVLAKLTVGGNTEFLNRAQLERRIRELRRDRVFYRYHFHCTAVEFYAVYK